MVEAAQTTAGCLSTSMTGADSPGAPSQSSRHPPSIRSSPRRRNGTGPPPNTHRRSSPAKQRPGPRSQPGDRSRSVGRRWRQRRPVARLRHYRAGRVPSSRSKGGSNLRHGEGCSICHGGRSVTWRRRFDRRTRRGSPRTDGGTRAHGRERRSSLRIRIHQHRGVWQIVLTIIPA